METRNLLWPEQRKQLNAQKEYAPGVPYLFADMRGRATATVGSEAAAAGPH